MPDLNFQRLSTVQNIDQIGPETIASAITIAPKTLITFVTGTFAVGTITPPVSGQHMLVLIYTTTTPVTMTTDGNILNAITPTSVLPTLMFYDPIQGKYYGFAGNLT